MTGTAACRAASGPAAVTRQVLAIDFGGTKVALGVGDAGATGGRPRTTVRLDTRGGEGAAQVVERTLAAARDLVAAEDEDGVVRAGLLALAAAGALGGVDQLRDDGEQHTERLGGGGDPELFEIGGLQDLVGRVLVHQSSPRCHLDRDVDEVHGTGDDGEGEQRRTGGPFVIGGEIRLDHERARPTHRVEDRLAREAIGGTGVTNGSGAAKDKR